MSSSISSGERMSSLTIAVCVVPSVISFALIFDTAKNIPLSFALFLYAGGLPTGGPGLKTPSPEHVTYFPEKPWLGPSPSSARGGPTTPTDECVHVTVFGFVGSSGHMNIAIGVLHNGKS